MNYSITIPKMQDEIINNLMQNEWNEYGIINECVRGFGGLKNPNRIKIYQHILHAEKIQDPAKESKSHYQITLDVKRTYGRLLNEEDSLRQKERLLKILDGIFVLHPEFKYYQGFHDIVSYLLFTSEDDELILGVSERLATLRFRQSLFDFNEALSGGKKALEIVSSIDPDLSNTLEEAGCDAMFAFPWYITWFLHSVEDIEVGLRLLDFFICTSDQDLINFISSMIISSREAIFALPEIEYSAIHIYFTGAPSRFTVNDVQRLINMSMYLRSSKCSLSYFLTVSSNPYELTIDPNSLLYIRILIVIMLLCHILMFYFSKD
ncbi:hypothetical protein, conserved [Entamoeba dispar SAW760]|uniref:Rab-GAP TBC domain-containing protein n=1 Tax=Entamoeba dispar (strain ATCC PRA-260 / SAW760) TaxID=370354 RepID=B0EHK5_ENTDS|nr:uncharacterized protein EDI_239020 [Entamoeba dispar SAW760]EDR26003.1 hypothetical protein, conserved [Entamoeba dispar SAW760]|eukprot:EDR26003.1 hypothetical protein, conserved [Entamoeba dispar SAW760]